MVEGGRVRLVVALLQLGGQTWDAPSGFGVRAARGGDNGGAAREGKYDAAFLPPRLAGLTDGSHGRRAGAGCGN